MTDTDRAESNARAVLEGALPAGHIALPDLMGVISSWEALDNYRDAVEARVRESVAADLESLQTYNNVHPEVAHVGRQQAIYVARNGRRK